MSTAVTPNGCGPALVVARRGRSARVLNTEIKEVVLKWRAREAPSDTHTHTARYLKIEEAVSAMFVALQGYCSRKFVTIT